MLSELKTGETGEKTAVIKKVARYGIQPPFLKKPQLMPTE